MKEKKDLSLVYALKEYARVNHVQGQHPTQVREKRNVKSKIKQKKL